MAPAASIAPNHPVRDSSNIFRIYVKNKKSLESCQLDCVNNIIPLCENKFYSIKILFLPFCQSKIKQKHNETMMPTGIE
jgi:hypothetical protein